VADSIILLKSNEPAEGYFGCFSGGKDSTVIKSLAVEAGVKVVWHYHMTTIDPPELLREMRRNHPDVIWDRPRHGNFFHRLATKKGLPTRRNRWCCDEYKEILGPKGCTKIMGVRVAESRARKQRYTSCTMKATAQRLNVYPIRLWEDADVWTYIRDRKLAYCSLYDEGFTRLGCVGCPMAGNKRRAEFDRWPGFEKAWKLASKRYFEMRQQQQPTQKDGREWFGTALFSTWENFWGWWVGNDSVLEWLRKNRPELYAERMTALASQNGADHE
jgi:phosphoadenosine phosphosulfate reductase